MSERAPTVSIPSKERKRVHAIPAERVELSCASSVTSRAIGPSKKESPNVGEGALGPWGTWGGGDNATADLRQCVRGSVVPWSLRNSGRRRVVQAAGGSGAANEFGRSRRASDGMSAGCGSFRHVCPVPSSEPAQIRGDHRPSLGRLEFACVSYYGGQRRILTGSLARSAAFFFSDRPT